MKLIEERFLIPEVYSSSQFDVQLQNSVPTDADFNCTFREALFGMGTVVQALSFMTHREVEDGNERR
jgi:hypothetical protein